MSSEAPKLADLLHMSKMYQGMSKGAMRAAKDYRPGESKDVLLAKKDAYLECAKIFSKRYRELGGK